MSYSDLVEQGRRTFESIEKLDRERLFIEIPNLAPWNQLHLNDMSDAYDNLLADLKVIYESKMLDTLPFNIINGMNAQLSNILQHCTQFIQNRNQNFYQNAFQQIESMRSNIRSWGLLFDTKIGDELREKADLINAEIGNILGKKKEVEDLTKNVQALIEPAVAGSLSKSFSDRKDSLHKNSNRWFWVSFGAAVVSLIVTVVIVDSIVGVLGSDIVKKAIEKFANSSGDILWMAIALRIAILLPIYSVFLFSFSQYRKERDLEEKYAHKSAVASSLPNYGSLAVDVKVKDQILSEASKVIFNSPTSVSSDKSAGVDKTFNQIDGLLKNIKSLIPIPKGD